MSQPETATHAKASPEAASPEAAPLGRSLTPPAFQLKASPLQRQTPEGEEPAPAEEKETFYIDNDEAYLRDEKGAKVEGNKTIPKLTPVIIDKTITVDKKEYVLVKSPDGKTEYGYTSRSNLYSLKWKPKDHEAAYKGISDIYNEQMQAVDPEKTRKDLIKSGTGVKALADKYYPNSTDPEKLASGFKEKVDKMITGFAGHGITAKKSAGLRHPLRSCIFRYAIDVANAADDAIIREANLVMTKYGIPIDWAHYKEDGTTIDLTTSKAKAEEVKKEFSISSRAAKGVDDFDGRTSNHNSGKAVDLNLTFSFAEKKDIKVGETTYSIDPVINKKDDIEDIANDGLTLFGKDQYGLTRALHDDPVHWSETGS